MSEVDPNYLKDGNSHGSAGDEMSLENKDSLSVSAVLLSLKQKKIQIDKELEGANVSNKRTHTIGKALFEAVQIMSEIDIG